ncbi:NACHT domain-containing protein [Natronospira sp.]|uniref:NACHT domain-containing protein n=1 Tax=Natronospira sp. TaxID=2024970 RepID=UPI0038736350
MEVNFSKIRTHNGSKNSGFEELICQLAHLQRPENGKRFVKKEGAGGDAGVECYWVLDDNSEIGWQAKYFPDGLNTSRWQQIDESFSKALEKHPNLRQYVVCLPIDKADSRKKGRGGNQVVSVEDEWLDHVKKWKKQALAIDREIEFVYWGKHEISALLMIDDPLYYGKALYWFNEPFLGSKIFRKIAKRSQDSLGDRYTPEFHVELPIARSFDGLCLNSSWWDLLKEKKSDLKEAGLEVVSFLRKEKESQSSLLENERLNGLNEQLHRVINDFDNGIMHRDFNNRLSDISSNLEHLSTIYSKIHQELHDKIDWTERKGNSRSILYKLSAVIDEVTSFLKQRMTVLSQTKSVLLHGEAGIGKSHLLCDLSLQRIKENLPTLFLLGAQYHGGNPVNFIKEALDLHSYRNSQVLGAIDAAGEASGARALIVIDAINEGNFRDEWRHQIMGFLSDLSEFQNIAIIFSCRSTYLNYILPESADEKHLPRIEHFGFRGHEHRAAEKFLSRQGISKPSVPILAPEFTNPLFLKTCCRALRQNGQSSFPKGLNSITSLFDFYVGSIEKIIARKKRFNPQENIIKSTLIDIASKLMPDNLEGIPKKEVRILVNNYDPNPNIDDSLFDILLDEGIISEDVSYKAEGRGNLIIRFTYERFSDYFIAQDLVDKIENIEVAFSGKGTISRLLKDNGYYSNAGIFEALAIIIPERFNRELEDLLPDDIEVEKWQLDQTFQNSVLWRSPNSFSDRTLEILNNLEGHFYSHPALNILLKLSTEPNHPWNAEMLHKNLVGKEIADRDHFWSTHIAYGDSSEEENEYESIVRAIIEWSYSGELETVEAERIRLCAITLLWFLTTPNRRVRDRSTKSLVRILSFYPRLVKGLLCDFSKINDTYLTERLYAVAYGVVCNINDENYVREIADITYSLIFKDENPIPHILLRDYARGILEYALHLGVAPSEANLEKFRPPYKSDPELQNPSIQEIEELDGDEFSSAIKSSLMGFLGDFGRYTMGCVHNWSSTPIYASKIENGIQLKERFATEFLSGGVQNEYLKQINALKIKDNKISPEELLKHFEITDYNSDEYRQSFENKRKKEEAFKDRVKAQLTEEQKEYFRWLSGVSNDRPAEFSRKWAQRWVCKRAHDFGWKKELFADFERMCSHGRSGGPRGGAMERVGKKYQWMAFHEFLARLSDNYHWINRGYSDIPDDDVYEGPWQIHMRDIDPTIWARQCGEYKTFHNKQSTWWQPYTFPFPIENDLTAKKNFLWDENILPIFSDLLKRKMPVDNSNWFVLHGHWSENRKYSDDESDSPYLDGWFRINSIIIRKGNYDLLANGVGSKPLIDPHVVSAPSTQHQGFLGEYPWHTVYRHISGWKKPDEIFRDQIVVEHLIPFAKYEWEDSGSDYSLNSSLYFHMPSKELIQDMQLSRPSGQWGVWESEGQHAFYDPSLQDYGPSYALMRTEILQKWLEDNDMEIVWLIGGEKMMFSSGASQFFGRLVYSGLYKIVDDSPVGKIWFDREEPRD